MMSATASWSQEDSSASVAPARVVPLTAGKMYSAVVVRPDLASAPEMAGHIDRIQEDLRLTTQLIVSESIQSLIFSGDLNAVLAQVSEVAKDRLSPTFMELNSKLPNDAIYLNSYVAQFPVSKDVAVVPVPMLGDVQVIPQDLNSMSKTEKTNFFYTLSQSIREAKSVERESFQVNAAAVTLKLERNYVAIMLQVLGELQPGVKPFSKENSQVKLDKLNILAGPESTDRPMALLTVTQRIPVIPVSLIKRDDMETYKPEIRVEFGKFGGIAGQDFGVFHGKLQTFQNRYPGPNDCEMNMRSVPSLSGVFGEEPTGIYVVDKILKNEKVRFRIQSINFEFDGNNQLQIANMKVPLAIEVPIAENQAVFQCLDLKTVNEKFGDEAQQVISDLIKKLSTKNSATPDLMNSMYE